MIKIKDKKSFFLGLTTIVLALILFFYSSQYPALSRGVLGAGFIPQLISVVSILCGLSIIFRSVNFKEKYPLIIKKNMIKVLILIFLTALYIFLLKKIDYFVLTVLYLIFLMLLIYPHKLNRGSLLKILVLAIVISYVFSFLFTTIFRVPL